MNTLVVYLFVASCLAALASTTAQSRCQINPHEKVECGNFARTKQECESSPEYCCWDDSQKVDPFAKYVPKCFQGYDTPGQVASKPVFISTFITTGLTNNEDAVMDMHRCLNPTHLAKDTTQPGRYSPLNGISDKEEKLVLPDSHGTPTFENQIPQEAVQAQLVDPFVIVDPFVTQPTTTTANATTTTQAYKRNKISLFTLIQMKRDNVPQEIINSLMADIIPEGELLYALNDGKLDANEILKLSKGSGVVYHPAISQFLSGKSMKGILYGQIAQAYGIDPIAVQLLMTNNKEPVFKHLVSQMSAKANLDPTMQLILGAVTSGGVTKDAKSNFIVNQIFKKESVYSREAFKAMIAGDKTRAKKWAYLAYYENSMPVKKYFPENEFLFAYLVDTQKNYPGKISPSIILALAQDHSIKALGSKNFANMFGIKAYNYVCAVLDPGLQIECEALKGRLHPSSLDCMNAGCCMHVSSSSPYKEIQCFQNVLGNIGVGLAERVWDVKHIVNTVFGGKLPTLANFYPSGVPWLSSNKQPDFTTFLNRDKSQPSWFSLLQLGNGRYLPPNPTAIPVIGPSKLRPNFVWKPHGATPHPFGTVMPSGQPVVTQEPGVMGGLATRPQPPSASVFAITPPSYVSCKAIPAKQRYGCMSNFLALQKNGTDVCASKGCCYDPIWRHWNVSICFRKLDSHGTCSNIHPEDRRDCGAPGISKTDCLANPRCCYDSTINPQRIIKPVPWCYFKTNAVYSMEETCRMTPHNQRKPCFLDKYGYMTNKMLSKISCEDAGCCYEEIKVSYLLQTLTKQVIPPSCFAYTQLPPIPTQTTTAATTISTTPAPEKSCVRAMALKPMDRISCGKYKFHTCVNVKGCCYAIPNMLTTPPKAPRCFRKS